LKSLPTDLKEACKYLSSCLQLAREVVRFVIGDSSSSYWTYTQLVKKYEELSAAKIRISAVLADSLVTEVIQARRSRSFRIEGRAFRCSWHAAEFFCSEVICACWQPFGAYLLEEPLYSRPELPPVFWFVPWCTENDENLQKALDILQTVMRRIKRRLEKVASWDIESLARECGADAAKAAKRRTKSQGAVSLILKNNPGTVLGDDGATILTDPTHSGCFNQGQNGKSPSSSKTPGGATPASQKPRWDGKKLWMGNRLVRDYSKKAAPEQAGILRAFEVAGWPESIVILPDKAETDDKRNLSTTINHLKSKLAPGTINFGGDGSGLGVKWFFARGQNNK